MHSEVNSISISECRDSIQEIESEETLEFSKEKYKFSNGCVFIGKLDDGKKQVMEPYIPNGDIYEGNWVNDKLDGYGIY